MKKFAAILVLGFSVVSASAATQTIKGFVEDQDCAGKPGMKGDSACAKGCIKNGSPAVLVTEDGKIYKISNQDKIISFAGENVTVQGEVSASGDTITVSKVN